MGNIAYMWFSDNIGNTENPHSEAELKMFAFFSLFLFIFSARRNCWILYKPKYYLICTQTWPGHPRGAVKALPNPPWDFEWHRKFCRWSGPYIERIATGADFLGRCSSPDGWDNVSDTGGSHFREPNTNHNTGLSRFSLTRDPCCAVVHLVNEHLMFQSKDSIGMLVRGKKHHSLEEHRQRLRVEGRCTFTIIFISSCIGQLSCDSKY